MGSRGLRGAVAVVVALATLGACAQPAPEEGAPSRRGSTAAATGGREAVAWAPPTSVAPPVTAPLPAPPPTSDPAPVTPPTPAVDAAATGPAPADAAPPGLGMPGGFTLNENGDGSTVRWDPCRVVRWQANVALAPPGALESLAQAFDHLADATGMTFEYGGTTTAMPNRAWLEGTAGSGSIVVAWAPKPASDLWSGSADGEGGWYTRGLSLDGVSWSWRIERGFVLIDPASTARYLDGFGSGVTLGALLLHELAHAVGLGHVDDPTQLMYPTLGAETSARYGDGDLAGLAQVGRRAGCIA